jgi:hypothetical protein
MTKKQEGGAGPREYEAAFKAEAGRLWQSRGQAAEKTAQELGIGCIQPLQVEAQRPAPPAAGALRSPRIERAICSSRSNGCSASGRG